MCLFIISVHYKDDDFGEVQYGTEFAKEGRSRMYKSRLRKSSSEQLAVLCIAYIERKIEYVCNLKKIALKRTKVKEWQVYEVRKRYRASSYIAAVHLTT